MKVVLEASLQHFTAGELLLLAAARGRSGTLSAEGTGKRARVFLRDGKIAWAEGGGGSVADIVTDLAGWSDGRVFVVDEASLPENAQPVALDVAPLIEEGQKRAQSIYPDEMLLVRVVPRPATDGAISLTPDEFQIVFQIGSGKQLVELRKATGRSAAEVYPVIKKLETMGVVEVVASGDTVKIAAINMTPPPSPPPEPATQVTPKPVTTGVRRTTGKGKAPLIATLTSDDGVMHPLIEDEITVGRDGRSSVALQGSSVSGNHAKIVRKPEGFVLEDIGSRNGTFVNGDRVTMPRVLADGDTIRFGREILIFNLAKDVPLKDTTQPEMQK